jgi:hypothetical protein
MVPFDVYGAILNNRRLLPRPSQQWRSLQSSAHAGLDADAAQLGLDIAPHALRATAATNALDHPADIAKVQEWLGHANIATTRIYDHRKTRPEDSPTSKSVIEESAHAKIRTSDPSKIERRRRHVKYRKRELTFLPLGTCFKMSPTRRAARTVMGSPVSNWVLLKLSLDNSISSCASSEAPVSPSSRINSSARGM